MGKRKRTPGVRPVLGAAQSGVRSLVPPAIFAAVMELIDGEAWDDAYAMLLEIEHKAPNDEMALSLLYQCATAALQFDTAERVALKLRRLNPRSLEALQMLAAAHAANERPGLTLRTLEEIAERFPAEDTPEARELTDEVRQVVTEMLAAFGQRYPENLDLLLLHEELQMLLGQEDYPAARRTMGTLRLRYPRFLPGLNNMALVLACEGEYEKAIAAAGEALEIEPDNIYALGNLIRFHCFLGQRDEAAAYVDRIKASKAAASERRLKMVEALSYFGDHDGVLSVQKQDAADDETPEATAKVLHHAAAAACNVDRRTTARRFWRQALELAPHVQIYEKNLEDLDLPVGERHGPVLFHLPQVLPGDIMTALLHAAHEAKGTSPDREAAIFRKLVRAHPLIVPFTPVVFASCDEGSVKTFLIIARLSEDPAMIKTIREFALGKRGSDSLRMEAMSIVRDVDPDSDARVCIWSSGEWRDVDFLGYEITDEPELENIDPKAQDLMEQGIMAHRAGRLEEAERIYREATALAPESRSIRNNLAAAVMMQGRTKEGREMIEEIHRSAPDYFFGRCNLASIRAREGDLAGAKALMEPILSQRKLHTTEFGALCSAQIEIAMLEDDNASAEQWLGMLEDVDPDHPFLSYREKLQQKTLLKSLEKLVSLPGRLRRKKPLKDGE